MKEVAKYIGQKFDYGADIQRSLKKKWRAAYQLQQGRPRLGMMEHCPVTRSLYGGVYFIRVEVEPPLISSHFYGKM